MTPPTAPYQGFVVSDLHLFSKRSTAVEKLDSIESAMSEAQVFVLNGDIFDFKWSTLGSISKTVDAAVSWLDGYSARYPQCQFHFVLGNHDSISAFVAVAKTLDKDRANFWLHPAFCRLGDKLFVHGDGVHAVGREDKLLRYRARFEHKKTKGRLQHSMYDCALHLNLQMVLPKLIPTEKVAKRLLQYLSNVAPQELSASRDIYFGHTHVPFSDYSLERWTFHNTGAMIRGMKSQIIPLSLEATLPGS